ncbi:GNAT family N-acetyltransferase [Piscibacillus halophilus]|uniref:Aminoglycoside 6'-N-acetyltransferase n=3 Tax=Piscibacillus halophilus TaxID=571933 RepID=A0A1H9DIB3_9BACI|nr:GNAT family N-acetyltransferase [Piscibacillus halophilus]SEQ13159.1 aminoglycoside 6'-N-acetyltransferase [Piscibacillus halophilus]
MITQFQGLTVRELEEKDQPFLVKWLSDPEVLQFYEGRDQPFDLEKVKQEFYEIDDGVTKCIVEYKGERIGYIQFYKVEAYYREKFGYKSERTFGLDQFIGEVDYWNKGIGTTLVKNMARYLLNRENADHVVMDPQTQNHRALRCYEKSGFKIVKLLPKHEWHEGAYRDCWLMEYQQNIE